MIRHVDPATPASTAMAPYNFVPLPNQVLEVEGGLDAGGKRLKPWECQDRYLPGTNSGWIDLSITTLTPLFIRGTVAPGSDEPTESRLRPDPFMVQDPANPSQRIPAIPGSSLRGMVRTIFEILSFAKISRVSREKPFYRSFGQDRITDAYRDRMMRGGVETQGGFLRQESGRWFIEPAEVLRVSHALLMPVGFSYAQNPGYNPQIRNRELLGKPFHLRRADDGYSCEAVSTEVAPTGAGWEPASLVLTGSAPNKAAEFAFVRRNGAVPIEIPEAKWRRFIDPDQISQWQEKNWPTGRGGNPSRRTAGEPCHGDPVFYLCDPDLREDHNPANLVFFGRAKMFRLPYDLAPYDLVPESIRNAGLDLAEALFGTVSDDTRPDQESLAGRVRFENAPAVSNANGWFHQVLVPEIMASPKPTAFQLYLAQDSRRGQWGLYTYLEGDPTQIRGHKLYWHRWDGQRGLAQLLAPDQNRLLDNLRQQARNAGGGGDGADRQHTVVRPVKEGVVFGGRVRFDNLTDAELGGLIEALQLPTACAHKLGMGKPLGFGSVRVEARVNLVNRSDRYRSWSMPSAAVDSKRVDTCRNAFRNLVLSHARESREAGASSTGRFEDVARIAELYAVLEWEKRPTRDETRYLKITGGDHPRYGDGNEYKRRPVLPTPHAVLGRPDPSGADALPPPAPVQRPQPGPDRRRPNPAALPPRPAAPVMRVPPPAPVRLPKRGDVVTGEVFFHPRNGKLYLRLRECGAEGPLDKKSKPIPEALSVAGARVRLKVEEASAKPTGVWTFSYVPDGSES